MGLSLPPIAFGTGSFRGLYREVPDDEAIEALHVALERGVTLIDTAPWYGAFQAEDIVGKALRGRSDFLISTKACLWSVNGEAVRGYHRDEVLWSFEGSLKRLGMAKVDVLHIHDPIEEAYALILDETYPTLAELKAQGLIGAISIGTGTLAAAQRYAAALPLDYVMLAGRYTLLDQSALPLLDELHTRGIPVWSAGIYSTGILATGSTSSAKYNYSTAPPQVVEQVRQLEHVCARHQVPLKAAAAQFVRQHPAIHTLVLGIESVVQLIDTLSTFDVSIPAEFWHDLKALNLIDPASPTPET